MSLEAGTTRIRETIGVDRSEVFRLALVAPVGTFSIAIRARRANEATGATARAA